MAGCFVWLNHLALGLMPLHYRIGVSTSSVRRSVEWTIFYPGSCVNFPATQSPVRVAMKSIILALVAAALTIGFGATISPGRFFWAFFLSSGWGLPLPGFFAQSAIMISREV